VTTNLTVLKNSAKSKTDRRKLHGKRGKCCVLVNTAKRIITTLRNYGPSYTECTVVHNSVLAFGQFCCTGNAVRFVWLNTQSGHINIYRCLKLAVVDTYQNLRHTASVCGHRVDLQSVVCFLLTDSHKLYKSCRLRLHVITLNYLTLGNRCLEVFQCDVTVWQLIWVFSDNDVFSQHIFVVLLIFIWLPFPFFVLYYPCYVYTYITRSLSWHLPCDRSVDFWSTDAMYLLYSVYRIVIAIGSSLECYRPVQFTFAVAHNRSWRLWLVSAYSHMTVVFCQRILQFAAVMSQCTYMYVYVTQLHRPLCGSQELWFYVRMDLIRFIAGYCKRWQLWMYQIAILKIRPEPDSTGYQTNYPVGTGYLDIWILVA